MKYRLKKDLPFAKAGAEVRKDDYLNSDSQTCFACGVYQFWVHKKVMNKWIEEVKPREGYIRSDHLDNYLCQLEDIAGGHWDKSRFIKVREVIE